MTPEGKVKQKVNKLLTLYPNLYKFMPVQTPYGTRTLDYLFCHYGQFGAIETKRSGKALTKQQEECRDAIRASGGVVFEIIGDDGLEELARWLKETEDAHNSRDKPKA